MRSGRVGFAGVTQKRVVPGPHFVIGGHVGPADVDATTRARLVDTAERLCRAVGLADGPANFDVIVRADGSFAVLEANVRLCGNAFPLLMRQMYGVDTVAALVSMALGEPFDLTPTRHGAGNHPRSRLAAGPRRRTDRGAWRARGPRPPRRRDLRGVRGSRAPRCKPFVQSANKLGYLVVTGPDRAAAEARLAAALDVLEIDVDGPSPTFQTHQQPHNDLGMRRGGAEGAACY